MYKSPMAKPKMGQKPNLFAKPGSMKKPLIPAEAENEAPD